MSPTLPAALRPRRQWLACFGIGAAALTMLLTACSPNTGGATPADNGTTLSPSAAWATPTTGTAPAAPKLSTTGAHHDTGVFINDPTAYTTAQLTDFVRLSGENGVKAIEVLVEWRAAEPTLGTLIWAPYAPLWSAVKAHNAAADSNHQVRLIADLAYAPPWAADKPAGSCQGHQLCAPTTAHVADFGAFAVAIAKASDTAGVPLELNIAVHENIVRGSHPEFLGGDATTYAAMFNQAANQVRAAYPAVRVNVGPIAPNNGSDGYAPDGFITALFASGLTALPDGVVLDTDHDTHFQASRISGILDSHGDGTASISARFAANYPHLGDVVREQWRGNQHDAGYHDTIAGTMILMAPGATTNTFKNNAVLGALLGS